MNVLTSVAAHHRRRNRSTSPAEALHRDQQALLNLPASGRGGIEAGGDARPWTLVAMRSATIASFVGRPGQCVGVGVLRAQTRADQEGGLQKRPRPQELTAWQLAPCMMSCSAPPTS